MSTADALLSEEVVMDAVDAELIESLRAGDERAIGVLLSRHAPAVYRFGLKMCRDPEDAKDVMQDTLLAAARGIREFRGASSLSTWLYTVARSFCIKKRRGAKGAPSAAVSLEHEPLARAAPSPEILPDDAVADRELGAALEGAIASLEPMYREVLVLRDVEGLSAAEVAEVLGVSVEAVKSRLHRARVDVRAKLEPFMPAAERSASAPSTAACPDIVALFSRYLEDEIGPDECASMQRHVASCKRCNAACNALKHTLALCRAEPRGEVPPDVQALVRKALVAVGAASKTI
jgi:RNA polymerase sigma-70 factor (ECF subfamily)